jgi:hypothetical protein
MPEEQNPQSTSSPPVITSPGLAAPKPRKCGVKSDEAVICERCGAEMFRMHAVWRCPACRFKTDCCGW